MSVPSLIKHEGSLDLCGKVGGPAAQCEQRQKDCVRMHRGKHHNSLVTVFAWLLFCQGRQIKLTGDITA